MYECLLYVYKGLGEKGRLGNKGLELVDATND